MFPNGTMDIMDIIRIMIITGILTIIKKDILPNAGIYPVVIIPEEIDAMVILNPEIIKNMPMMILTVIAGPLAKEMGILDAETVGMLPEEMKRSLKEIPKNSVKEL